MSPIKPDGSRETVAPSEHGKKPDKHSHPVSQTPRQKNVEAIGAFKFTSFGFLSDPRVVGISFGGIDFPNLLADLAFKIIMTDDESALRKIMQIGTTFKVENGSLKTQSVYPVPTFKDKDEANQHYEEILNIILTYQDRIPPSLWRNKE